MVYTKNIHRSKGKPTDTGIYRPLGYERVYLPLCKVPDTPSHIQGDDSPYRPTDLISKSHGVFI